MNRVKEYIRFAVWFSGVGYAGLWPLTAQDDGLAAVNMSFICHPLPLLDFMCGSRAALHLSPGLHLAGMMSSASVVICVLLRPLRRRLRPAPSATPRVTPLQLARLRLVARILPKPAPPPPRRYVRPRAHFGLRNAPH